MIGKVLALSVLLLPVCVVRAVAWEVSAEVGAGAIYSSVYYGSDEGYLIPVPVAKISLTHESTAIQLSLLEGLGIRRIFGESGAFAELSLNIGDKRDSETYQLYGMDKSHSERTKDFLSGSPTVETTLETKATIGYFTQWGTFLGSIEYDPINVDHTDDRFDANNISGLIYGFLYCIDRKFGDSITVNGVVGLEFMNNAYADAWYSNRKATARLGRFEAVGGLRNLMGAIEASGKLSENIGIKTTLAASLLMGDAADSPYTRQKFQPTGLVQFNYSF